MTACKPEYINTIIFIWICTYTLTFLADCPRCDQELRSPVENKQTVTLRSKVKLNRRSHKKGTGNSKSYEFLIKAAL